MKIRVNMACMRIEKIFWWQSTIHILMHLWSPLKFFITSFLAAAGLLFNSGEECLLNPFVGVFRAEKLARFWASVISGVSGLRFLFWCCTLVGEVWQLSLSFRFLWFAFSSQADWSDSGGLWPLERGIHSFIKATQFGLLL